MCIDVKVSTRYDGRHIQWKLGPCFNNFKYKDYAHYIHRCCLELGQHTLTCNNPKVPEGWKNGYIEIKGLQYCDDFMGYKAMRNISITSTKLNYLTSKKYFVI